MNTYHKIQTIFKRDPATKYKTLLMGQYSTPELEYLANNEWVFTEKVDGTNVRIIFNGKTFEFRGKTDKADFHKPLLEKLSRKMLPQTSFFRDDFSEGVCLYGEGYGPKIQKGGKYRGDQDFVLFDIKVGSWWLKREDVEFIGKECGLDVVPIVGHGKLYDAIQLTKNGMKSTWGDFTMEGLICKPIVELKSRNGHRIITKIKHKDF